MFFCLYMFVYFQCFHCHSQILVNPISTTPVPCSSDYPHAEHIVLKAHKQSVGGNSLGFACVSIIIRNIVKQLLHRNVETDQWQSFFDWTQWRTKNAIKTILIAALCVVLHLASMCTDRIVRHRVHFMSGTKIEWVVFVTVKTILYSFLLEMFFITAIFLLMCLVPFNFIVFFCVRVNASFTRNWLVFTLIQATRSERKRVLWLIIYFNDLCQLKSLSSTHISTYTHLLSTLLLWCRCLYVIW